MKIFYRFFIFVSVILISLFTFILTSCTGNKYNYDFVVTSPGLSGNLAVLGFKPTVQSLYNKKTLIPKYIEELKIDTEFGKQPTSGNAELWIKNSPGILYYDYLSLSNDSTLNKYGFINYIQQSSMTNIFDDNLPSSLNDRVDNAAALSKPWNICKYITELGKNLNNVIKEDIFDNKSKLVNIIESVKSSLKSIFSKFNEKFPSNTTISFWGASYGPNIVHDLTKFDEYGPSIFFPGWMYTAANDYSLKWQPAVPENNPNWKLRTFNNGGYNATGWLPSRGTYQPKAVQEVFANSSDIVVVALDSSIMRDNNLKAKVKENFSPMLKNKSLKNNLILLDETTFNLSYGDILGSKQLIYQLAESLLDERLYQEIIGIPLFKLNKLQTLSRSNFNFNVKN